MSAWFEAWTGWRLLTPAWLALGAAFALAAWLRTRRGAPALTFAPAPFLGGLQPTPGRESQRAAALPHTLREYLVLVPRFLHGLGLAALLLALARPVRRTPEAETHAGIDIVLCLDVSSSMQADDLDPPRTRLQVAKAIAAQFIAQRPLDRIGLVCFARYPDLRCPLTLDHAALLRLLDEVALVADDTQEDATGIGTALARAALVLRAAAATAKVIVLLSDGEENVATAQTPDEIAPLHAAQLCAEQGVRAYTIAAGRGERQPDGSLRALDTKPIETVAERTRGKFFAAPDAEALAQVYREIDVLERAPLQEPRFVVEERCTPVLLLGALLLALGRLLRPHTEALP